MNVFLYASPYGFKIRTKADAQRFCTELLKSGMKDIPDLKNQKFYYRLSKGDDGLVSLGHAKYGPDPLLADPVFMETDNIVERVYQARKSINASLFCD